MDAQSIIARRVARELRAGNPVNLGIGIPTRVAKAANALPASPN
jgi:acetate CoA/acetoacetate CoA-transferase beta subunit